MAAASTMTKELAETMRERVREIEAEATRLKRAAYELDPRGRKPGDAERQSANDS